MDDAWTLVTGGAGFIGSHLVDALLAEGRRVRVVDDLSSGRRANLPPGVELLEGDVLSVAARALEGARTVFHLASMVSVPKSVEDPRGSHRATAEGTIALLEAAQAAGVRRVVCASSSAVYGDGPGLPRREDQPTAPLSPYAIAKRVSEMYAAWWAAEGRLETVCLRFFNVFGPRQDPLSAYAAAIPIFLKHLQAQEPVPIYGDGTQTRDFTFVEDVVQGLLSAAAAPDVSGRVFNIASGRSVEVIELARTMASVMGVPPRFRFLPPRAGDIRRSSADVSAARRHLGFEARVGLRDGLQKTVDWFLRCGPPVPGRA
jgi:UDP-glucose 4-epimerase